MRPLRVFIYCLKCPVTGDVRYIGKTHDLTGRFKQHTTVSVKKKGYLGNWLRSLSEPPVLVTLHEVAENESWQEEERRYISCARALGVELVNMTDGGDGGSGPKSPETRAAMSAAMKGVLKSPEHCAALSAVKTGVPQGPHSPETRAAISAAKKGVMPSLEHRLALRVPKSAKTCAAMSAARRGVPWTPARRAAYERRYPVQTL